jgi:hypothetical protein
MAARVPKTSGQGVSRIAYKTANALGNKGAASGAGEKFKTTAGKRGRPAKPKDYSGNKPGRDKGDFTNPIDSLVGRDYAK